MSLNNIKLPNSTIEVLYSNMLVEEKKEELMKAPLPTEPLVMLGNNNKNIIIITENTASTYLPDDELNFLLNILSACKLNMNDVAILNLDKNKLLTYAVIETELLASIIILFGKNVDAISLPINNIPSFQLQQFNNQTYICSPSLKEIEQDKILKGKLWNCLKQVFST